MSKSEDNPDMRVLKTSSCKTITGKSNIKFCIGCLPDGSVHLRIVENDGGGMFSNEWVAYEAIQEALKDDREGAAITSVRLTSLFKGKSVNTPSFLLAALKHLKLVRSMNGKQRHHELLDPKPFLDQVNKLMASDVAVKHEGKTEGKTTKKAPVKKTVRKATVKKAAIKKRAMSKKKTSSTG